MKRLLLAELIVLLSLSVLLVGLILLETLGVVSFGRDPRPLMVLSAVVLVGAGFAVSYFFRLTVLQHLIAMLPWLMLLYWLVAYGTGLWVPDAIFMWWFMRLSATLVFPWALGALLGAWTRNARSR